MEMKVIAHIKSDFPTKFGIPHQSGRIKELKAEIVFEPEYQVAEAFRGIEEYTHLWLIWEFSQAVRKDWSPTVRPPRTWGKYPKRRFCHKIPFSAQSHRSFQCEAGRRGIHQPGASPSCVRCGSDGWDAIYDIKPYLAYVDSHPEASGGFTDQIQDHKLKVDFPAGLLEQVPKEKRAALLAVLANDPRPGYQKDPDREYGMSFGNQDIHFKVDGELLRVIRN